MIFQAISQMKLSLTMEPCAVSPVEGGEATQSTAIGGFSLVLAGLCPQAEAIGSPIETPTQGNSPAADRPAESPSSGRLANQIAASGKILPPLPPLPAALPDESGSVQPIREGESHGQGGVEGEGAMAVLALANLVASPLLEAIGQVRAAMPEPAPTSIATYSKPVGARPITIGKHDEEPVAAPQVRGEQTSKPSVSLHVAPPREGFEKFSAERNVPANQRIGVERSEKPVSKSVPEAAPLQSGPTPAAPAASALAVVTPTGTERASEQGQHSSPARPAIDTQVTRELGRVIDSLASAREAQTAKTATLAVEHSEFGELSLRFSQRSDGQLAVQLSAADLDAHRAVAAALAERSAFAQPDASGSHGQQQSQAQSYPGHGSRGTAAERDTNGMGQNTARQDRNEPQRGDPREGSTGKGGASSSGIFA